MKNPPQSKEHRNVARVFLAEKRGRFLIGTPAFRSGAPVELAKLNHKHNKIKEGDLCAVLKPLHLRRKQKPPVIQRIGTVTCVHDVIKALLVEHEQQRTFPQTVENHAKQAINQAEHAHERNDLRELSTFTIDPVDAKDFDDAISAKELDDETVRVWVHIADVSAFVRPGSATDKAAFARGTSVYVPGRVVPMLPEALCNDACSLKPGVDRFTVTVEMDVSGEEVKRVRFYRSLIRSDCRLTYEDVDDIFAGKREAEEHWQTSLQAARKAAHGLGKRFSHSGALDIETDEPQFEFSSKGTIRAGSAVKHTESHTLIEHLMVATNEQVAMFLAAQQAPTLYRVHPQPEPEAVERLIGQLDALAIPTPPIPEVLSPSEANELLGAISRAINAYTQQQKRGRTAWPGLVLRATQRAFYSERNLGHSGLGIHHYCHFTSPIRRYPDIVCHRALLATLSTEEVSPQGSDLQEQAQWLSNQERNAEQIERKGDRIASAFLLLEMLGEDHWDTIFEGEITGIINAGVFVAFHGIFEGFIPLRHLGKDTWWELDESEVILEGQPKGTLALGDSIQVKVTRVDRLLGKIDLEHVENQPPALN